MDHYDLTQTEVAKRANCSQKTISNILSAGQLQRTISLAALDQVATGLGLPTYVLLIPNFDPTTTPPIELEQLIGKFSTTNHSGRSTILGVAEMAPSYIRSSKTT